MKELSIEEKTKVYDEAIERLRNAFYDNNSRMCEEYRNAALKIIEPIFPELKESEDERIRKELISFVRRQIECHDKPNVERDEKYESWIAWLEKQGEQKPVVDTKVIIPKFRVGDIVKSKSQPMLIPRKIISIGKDCYWCEDRGCIGFAWEDDYEIVEQKQGEQNSAETVKWSPQEESCICQLESLVKEQWRQAERVHNSVNIKKMSELMFFLKTLNPNKKQQIIISAEEKEAMYDKLAWSEENDDDAWLNDIISKAEYNLQLNKDEIDFLKSLKDRVQPQPKQEWSEEDENHVKSILSTIECCKAQFPNAQAVVEAYNADIEWLKSIRPQNTWKLSGLPHWQKSNLPNHTTTGFNSDYFCHKGYCINYKELFEKLPKDD